MKDLTYALVAAVCLSTSGWAGELSKEELIFIGIRSTLLEEIVVKPVDKTSAINKTAEGIKMLGSAVTHGDIKVIAYDSYDGVGFTVQVDTTTNSTSNNSKGVGRTITSNFPWTVTTVANTTKHFLLREDGVAHYEATTNSCVSTVAFQGVEADAFSRAHLHDRPIMERIAERRPLIRRLRERPLIQEIKENLVERGTEKQLPNQKAKIESGFTKEVSDTVTPLVNKDAFNYILPYHHNYQTYVYEPFIVNQLLGGRFSFGSSKEWLVLKGIRGKDKQLVDPKQQVALHGKQASIFVGVHQDFFERFLEMQFGETEVTEVEGLELIGRKTPPQKTLADILGNEFEEVTLLFHEEKPIRFHFNDDKIVMTFRFREMTSLGKTVFNVQLSREIKIEKGPGKLLLVQNPPKEILTFDGKPIDKVLEKHILDRFKKALPDAPTDLAKVILFEDIKPMVIKNLGARNGHVMIDLDFVRK